MIRVHILVEGQTEETFVRDVLMPHCAARDIYLHTILATTKRVKSGPNFRGGITGYGKVYNHIRRLLQDSYVAAVTTMIDYYGLPDDFPGMDDRPEGNCYARVDHVQTAWADAVGDRRFLPFLTLHEYEALLFSAPNAAAYYGPRHRIVHAADRRARDGSQRSSDRRS